MLIKSFKAPTLKEAMANVKAELGVDAVILHTSKTKKGGILGFHSKEVVEVIAAVEDEASKPAPVVPVNEAVLQAAAEARSSRAAAREAAGQQSYGVPEADISPISATLANFTPRSAVNQYQTAGTMEAISHAMAQNTPSQTFGEVLASVNQAQEAANEPVEVDIAAAVAAEPVSEMMQPMQPVEPAPVEPVAAEQVRVAAEPEPAKIEVAKAEEAAAKEEVQPEAPAEVSEASVADDQPEEAAPDESGKDEEIRDLQNQLEEMKAMLMEMSRNKGAGDAVPTLQNAMQSQEVTEKIIQDMIAKLNGTEILAPSNSVKAANALEKYIRKAIRVANGITLYSNKPKVVALIGPTGVGKTTTLAKIAAKFVLEQGARVALITADTYRISAVEQLKTYSDILGLPLEIVYNPEALRKAIEKHKDKQLILIDTAGRSQYNEYQMKELSGLLSIDADIEKHLVMSATTKTSDGVELLENFSICQPDRVIFTKVDETGTHGIILNILHRRKVALSYITNGQSVPDDIEPASVERLAELLLR
ncbi:MAG: flagellar biosynthesis protein FlhF [Selenomonadaceae bacterium]|nr:flagellar biosynthesis protein FlhF [Selenomonadaceae bacterium]